MKVGKTQMISLRPPSHRMKDPLYREAKGDWVKKKRTGAKKRRYVVGLIARKIYRSLRKYSVYGRKDARYTWACEEMKRRKWTWEQVLKYKDGQYWTGQVGKKSWEESGMDVWKRRGLV